MSPAIVGIAAIDAVLFVQLAYAGRYHQRHRGSPVFKQEEKDSPEHPPYFGPPDD
jgi:hypothetical protein